MKKSRPANKKTGFVGVDQKIDTQCPMLIWWSPLYSASLGGDTIIGTN